MVKALRVKLVLPALTEATSPYWRPIKYSLFPPLGLATLAAYLAPDDEAVIVDEHVEPLDTNDRPDLVVIQVYITNAYRAYRLADHYRAKGTFVALGGLHVTSLPEEALPHADAIFLGPGEQPFPKFLDDHLLGDRRFAAALFAGMRGMNRLFQGAATVDSILQGDVIERAAEAGLRSLFVGFETLTPGNLARSNKVQNLGRDYKAVTDRLHGLGIMINGSFVFGMDDDEPDVFRRTVDWAIEQGVTTATFHIQTPYPGTKLFERMEQEGRIVTRDWNRYDTRHVVYRPARLMPEALKEGYDWAYREFYRWSAIGRAALAHGTLKHQAKHFFYAAGWKKFEPLWDVMIRARQLRRMTPLLEAVLSKLSHASLNPFDSKGDPIAAAEAQRGDAAFEIPLLQRIQQRGEHARTARADRMA